MTLTPKPEKNPVHGPAAEGGFVDDGAKAHPSGVKETLSPAMDILVSNLPPPAPRHAPLTTTSGKQQLRAPPLVPRLHHPTSPRSARARETTSRMLKSQGMAIAAQEQGRLQRR